MSARCVPGYVNTPSKRVAIITILNTQAGERQCRKERLIVAFFIYLFIHLFINVFTDSFIYIDIFFLVVANSPFLPCSLCDILGGKIHCLVVSQKFYVKLD